MGDPGQSEKGKSLNLRLHKKIKATSPIDVAWYPTTRGTYKNMCPQSFQIINFRLLANTPWYVNYRTLRNGLNVSKVSTLASAYYLIETPSFTRILSFSN